jgi:hypothetical protein
MRPMKTSSSQSTCEHLLLCSSRLYYSRLYYYFYVLMIIINTGLLVGLGLLHLSTETEFPTGIIALEVIVTSILLLEVLCRICSQGKTTFFSSWCNLLDSGVVVLCIVSVVLFLSLPRGNDLEEAVATVLMTCRYAVHFVRVLMMLKLTRKQQVLRGRRRSMDITFDKINEDDEEDFGIIEMAALGGFDDFEGYSERVNTVLGDESAHKHVSEFDKMVAKHLQNSPARKKMTKKNNDEVVKERSDDVEENTRKKQSRTVTPTTPYHD